MYSSLSLLGTDQHLGCCLGNDSWGSSVSSVGNRGSSISSMGNWGSNMSSSNGSSGVCSSGNWGSNMSSNWDMGNSMDWGGNSLVDNWLVDSLVSTDRSGDVLGS